jgi:putative transcriptional regulator
VVTSGILGSTADIHRPVTFATGRHFPIHEPICFIYDALYDLVQDVPPGGQMTASTPTAIDFSALVREIRQARHITQEQLARELQVTFSTVNGWENGKHRPIPALARSLVELAEASKIPQRRYTSRGARAGSRARRRA